MTDFESSIVTSIDSLRALYAQPIERIAKKQLDHINEAGRAFIAASPFSFSQQEANKVSTARPKATSRAL